MRKGRKPRVVWLPPSQDGQPVQVTSTGWFINPTPLPISGNEPTASVEIPLVIDAPVDPLTSTLSDVESSGYRLRRIVGKLFILGDTLDDQSGIPLIGVTAGIIVRRVDEAGVSLASQLGLNQNGASPSETQNWTDPWIWRRSWLIGNPTLFTAPPEAEGLPWHNLQASSAFDGPHIDQKTARLIGPEERLFLDVSATALLGADGQSELTNLTEFFGEIRVLASMRTSSGNRRNASR